MAGTEVAPAAHDDVEEVEREATDGRSKKKVMRVVVLKGRTVMHGGKTHGDNAEITLPIDEATHLIGTGFVRQTGSDDDGRKPGPLPKAGSDTSK
jgi:hypothetical protein